MMPYTFTGREHAGLCICGIRHMWNQADKNTITLTDMEHFGWKIIEQLTIVWDSEENISKIQTPAKSKHE